MFDACDIARDALRQVCEELTVELNSREEMLFGLSYRSSRTKANFKIISLDQSDIGDVVSTVKGLEAAWRQRHSIVS